MAELTLQYPDDLLVMSGKSRSEVERELKFQLAVRLFEFGQLSLGKAAELAGWNRVRFADELSRLKIPGNPILRLNQPPHSGASDPLTFVENGLEFGDRFEVLRASGGTFDLGFEFRGEAVCASCTCGAMTLLARCRFAPIRPLLDPGAE